jgi:PAS domain S-box-containing protein
MVPVAADLLDRLIDANPAPIIVADVRGRILLFSPAAEALLGYRGGEAREHLHVTDLYHRPDEARRVLERVRARRPGVAPAHDRLDVTLRARNGELVPVRLSVSLLRDAAGDVVGTLGIFEDLREEVALRRRLEDAADQVVASERRASGLGVVGRVAHDLSQPLTAAMGNLEMLAAVPDLTATQADRLDRTWEQLERMRRIVHEFSQIAASPWAALPDEPEEAG